MTTINLRDFYPWYTHDEYIGVSDDVAEELRADQRYEKAHWRRMFRNKSIYTLDADNGIETEACFAASSLHEVVEHGETMCQLCRALNSLPDTQGRRVEAHYILGRSMTEIAMEEGISVGAVSASISRGLKSMGAFLKAFGIEK